MSEINKLIRKVKKYNPKVDEAIIKEAYELAREHHSKQFRASGKKFIEHPLEVAFILTDIEVDGATITAALLHDILEDTDVTPKEVEKTFGKEVFALIDGVTKLNRIQFKSQKEHQAENFRKMFLAMAKDLRVILIKLADRLHNMETIKFLPKEKWRRIALETREIYTPLAHRLGVFQLKWRLEDLSFEILEPRKYAQISKMVAEKRVRRERYINNAIKFIKNELKRLKIKAEVTGRVKHFYSIYQKMAKRRKDFNEIYDLLAIRVLVDKTSDCYAVLGALHSIYKPVPGRFKDYIAVPKVNMYQSLHTIIIGENGRPLEIQIRTFKMHRVSEFGVAAHWTYKEDIKGKKKNKQLRWVKQILSLNHSGDSADFLETIKSDLFEQEVFVFTPKGDVKSLPVGSTPIDFAYSIHTEVGHSMIGAKANSKIVPLEYKLQMGDIIDILSSKNSSGPSRDWLKLVKTSKARSSIRQFFSKEGKDDFVQIGKDELIKVLRKNKIRFIISKQLKLLEKIAKTLNFKSTDELFRSMGERKTSSKQIVTKIVNELNIKEETEHETSPEAAVATKKKTASKTGVVVKGVSDVMIRLARCCNPVLNDEIVGFITRGRGISVHRTDCPNLALIKKQTPDRLIDIYWDAQMAMNFQVELQVEALDRVKLLKDISTAISDSGVSIISANVSTTKDGFAICRFIVEIGNISHLNNIIINVKKVDAVFDAYRV